MFKFSVEKNKSRPALFCDSCGAEITDAQRALVCETPAGLKFVHKNLDGRSCDTHETPWEDLEFFLSAICHNLNLDTAEFMRKRQKMLIALHTRTTPEELKRDQATFEKLAKLEPALSVLLNDVRAAKDDGGPAGFCANTVWLRKFKPRLRQLVGYETTNKTPVLQTASAYDAVYNVTYEALPPCRDCGCI